MNEIVDAPICASCQNYLSVLSHNKKIVCSQCGHSYKLNQNQKHLCDVCNSNKCYKFETNMFARRGVSIFCSNPKCPSYHVCVAKYPEYSVIYLLQEHYKLLECFVTNSLKLYWHSPVSAAEEEAPVTWIYKFFIKALVHHKYRLYKENGIYKVKKKVA